MNPIYASRRRKDIIIRALCVGAALFGVTWLALILFTLFYNGLAGLSMQLFTQNTPPPGSTEGGLLNAIVGSVIMTVIGVGIGAPLGLFAGTYLAEYGKHDRLTSVIRFINDILLSARPRSSSACSSMARWWCRWAASRRSPARWRWR